MSKTLGQVAYEAYYARTSCANFPFADNMPASRAAWEAAAAAAVVERDQQRDALLKMLERVTSELRVAVRRYGNECFVTPGRPTRGDELYMDRLNDLIAESNALQAEVKGRA